MRFSAYAMAKIWPRDRGFALPLLAAVNSRTLADRAPRDLPGLSGTLDHLPEVRPRAGL